MLRVEKDKIFRLIIEKLLELVVLVAKAEEFRTWV